MLVRIIILTHFFLSYVAFPFSRCDTTFLGLCKGEFSVVIGCIFHSVDF